MKTVLVADDFASVRFYHATLLRQMGCNVVAAADGVEALDLLRKHRVDLVLLDMLMPGIGGCEFLRQARSLPGYEQLPVVVVTTEAGPQEESRFRAAGVSAFLAKPALPGALERAMRPLLG